ncbi:Y-family DNA polymerase [Deinococcus sp. KSM4-11]|uniref:Y-family DNA polymerase n=1 Tax=Deinococcus sp. KSM4-11 TaxID=2568654 RepID=UPI001F1073CA|nr:Y-family DNA polymerase [Deinococcus sp. KSM4-11]
MPPAAHVACVLLAPWSLTLLERGHVGLPVAVLNEAGRVLHVNVLARLGGVDVGMKEAAALSRCPELHAEVVSAPTAQAAWNELLETLYARYSDRVEGREPGIAYVALSVSGARELAAALHAPVGYAASLEVAHLAALRAKPGEVREMSSAAGGKAEDAFLALTPLDHLNILGLSPGHLERLRFLGLRGLADLLKWSAAQREAFLGVDAARTLQRFLKGQRTTTVARYVPGQVIETSLSTDQPLVEPGETAAVLAELIPVVWAELRGRTCAYLTLHADTVGGRLSISRRLKWPVDGAGLERLAVQGLETTDALALGIERITVQLSGLALPARMVGLWAGVAELQVTTDVLKRFPDALVKVHWLDPWAYVADARYEWVDWLTGEVRPTPLTPPRPAPMSLARRHENAVNRVIAFFEGASP